MDHILILKYCNFVSVSLDSDTRPLMIPVCTAHPSPLMLRALGLESYLKLRTCKASSLVQLSHLDHFVFQDSLLFEFSIFALHLDLDAEFCGQLISHLDFLKERAVPSAFLANFGRPAKSVCVCVRDVFQTL